MMRLFGTAIFLLLALTFPVLLPLQAQDSTTCTQNDIYQERWQANQEIEYLRIGLSVWNNTSLDVSPDGTVLAVGNQNTLRLYTTDTLMLETELESDVTVPTGSYRDVSWSPDGNLLAAGYRVFDSPDAPNPVNGVQIWDIQQQEMTALLPIRLQTIDWSPDGSIIAITDITGDIVLWDVERQLSLNLYQHELEGGTRMANLAWSPNADYLAGADNSGNRPVQLFTLDGTPEVVELPRDSGGEHLSWSPDSEELAVTTHVAPDVWIWSVVDAQVKQTLTGSRGNGLELQWSPDGKWLARGTNLGLYLWDMTSENTTPARVFDENVPPFVRIAWLPDSQHLISVDLEGSIYRWDIETGCVEAAVLTDWRFEGR